MAQARSDFRLTSLHSNWLGCWLPVLRCNGSVGDEGQYLQFGTSLTDATSNTDVDSVWAGAGPVSDASSHNARIIVRLCQNRSTSG